jgi:hypothetical protein
MSVDPPKLAPLEQDELAVRWASAIRCSIWQHRTAEILDSKSKPVALVLMASGAMVYLFRMGGMASWKHLFWFQALAWMLWLSRWPRFLIKREQVVRRLDSALGLDHDLFLAEEGRGAWPDADVLQRAKSVFRLKAFKPLGIMMCGIVVLSYATMVTVEPNAKDAVHSPSLNPWLVEEMEQSLGFLEEDEGLAQETIEEWKQELQALKDQARQNRDADAEASAFQNQQAKLREATDRLHEEMIRSVSETQFTLEQLRDRVGALSREARERAWKVSRSASEPSERLNRQEHQALAKDARLNEMLEKAQNLRLSWKPSATGASQSTMQNMSASLSSSALRRELQNLPNLQSSIEQSLKACSSCTGSAGNVGTGKIAGSMQGEGHIPGRGGVGRGGMDAALTLGKEQPPLPLNNLQALPAAEKPQLGDHLEQLDLAPETNDSPWRSVSSGGQAQEAPNSTGIMWKTRLTPAEKKLLHRWRE